MRAVAKFYVIPVIFFIISVALILYIKPESRERLENVTNFTCITVYQNYYVLENVNRTPNYQTSSTFTRGVSNNTTIFIGKVNITNLENIPILYFVNYTFHVVTEDKTTFDDIYRVNVTISANNFETVPFYNETNRAADANGTFVVSAQNISIFENVTKTNSTLKCF